MNYFFAMQTVRRLTQSAGSLSGKTLLWVAWILLLFLMAFTNRANAQTNPSSITVSGACLSGSYTLTKITDDYESTGKPAYQGTGDVTINSTIYPNETLTIYYEAAGPAWVLAFGGGPYQANYTTTDLPPTSGWTAVTDGVTGTCTGTNPLTVQLNVPTTAPTLATPANGSGQNPPRPTYTGTASPGSTVTVYVDGNSIGTTVATGGTFSLLQPTNLTEGSYTVYATAQLSGQAVSANSNSNTFTVDATAPTVSSIVRNNPTGTTTNGTAVIFGVNFSEDVSGVDIGSFLLTTTGSAAGTIVGVQRVNNTSNSQYLVIVSGVSGNGTLRLDVKGSGSGISDGVGNALSSGFTNGQTFTIDQIAPTVTLGSPVGTSGTTTRLSPIPFTVSFSESVTGFTANRVTVGNGTLSDFVGSGSGPYTFNVTPSGNGLVTVSVAANQTSDAAGNGNAAATPFSIDYQPLTITGLAGPGSACLGSPIPFTATVNNASGPYAFTLAGGTSTVVSTASGTFFSRTITASGSGPQTYTLTVQDASQRTVLVAAQPVTINALPVVAITGLASAYCQNASVVTLTGTPAGGSFTIDGTAATQFNPAQLQAGDRSVGYTFTDANGCTGTATQLVTIKVVPAPSLLTQSGGAYPASQSAVTVDVNSGTVNLVVSGCNGTIAWSGPNNTSGNGSTINVPTSQPGTFTYQASCTADGCTSPLAVASVTVGGRLTVLHRDVDNYANNNAIQPLIELQNQGLGTLPLANLTLRYYLTVEGAAALSNLSVNYAQVGNGNVRLRYVPLQPAQPGAAGYVEYSFTAGAGSLAPQGSSGPIQTYFAKSDYSGLNELDDYSYALIRNQLVGNLRITAYYNGVLIAGIEPGTNAQIRALRALTESKNGPSATQINTYLTVRNEGNVAVNYSDLRARYYFTSDGPERLQVEVDEGNVQTQLVALSQPVGGANYYLEIRFNQAGQLAPGASAGRVRYRISKPDGGRFNQANDYSYQEQPAESSSNGRVVVYVGADRVWGNEPSGSARIGSTEPETDLAVTVLGNPVRGEAVSVQIKGASGGPLRLQLVSAQGKVITQHQVASPQAVEQHALSLKGQAPGVLLLQVSTPTQSQTIRVLKAE